MRSWSFVFCVSLLKYCFVASAQVPATTPANPPRPAITGISHIAFYASNAAATEHFFSFDIGAAKTPDPENALGQRYYINSTQFIEVLPLPPGKTATLLDHAAFVTTDAQALRTYLAANNEAPGALQTGSDDSHWFKINDPEGNVIEFVQYSPQTPSMPAYKPVGHHIIHIGFVVNNYETEDYFYKGLLGFRPYWYGGRTPGALAWVSQQVPDGNDWLEYMLPNGTPGTPRPAASMGGSNHLSIGVLNMTSTAAELKAANRLGEGFNGPKVGLDGKWQLNLFDPDGNRVEVMEYGNVQPPCCSVFTAPNPKPPID